MRCRAFQCLVVVSLRGPERAMLGGAARERCTHKGCRLLSVPAAAGEDLSLLQAIGTCLLHCAPEVVLGGVTASHSRVFRCDGRVGKGVTE